MKQRAWVFCRAGGRTAWRALVRAWAQALALWATVGIAAAAPDPASGLIRLTDADFVLSAGASPPPDAAGWKPVALPQAWVHAHGRTQGAGWYRFRFRLEQKPTALQSLYWAALCCAFEVHVNGSLVGRTGSAERPLLLSVPQRLDVPPTLLVAGENRVDLRLEHQWPMWSVVSALEVGPHELLRPRERARWWLAVGGTQLLPPLALTISAFVLLLWVKRRAEQMLGFFGLSSLAFAVYAAGWLFVQPPLPLHHWMVVRGAAAMTINVTGTLTAMRYAGLRWPRIEWALWALIPLAVYQVVSGFQWWGARAFGLFWQFAPLMYIGAFAFALWRRRTLESLLLFVTAPGCLAASLWLGSGAAPADAFDPHGYAFLPMHLLIVWMLVQRHVQALGTAEQLNVELEQRVAAKAAQLEDQHARMQQLTREAAVAEERRRIMSDMHDGIGGQLISTLGLVEHGKAAPAEVAAALRECIDDLRLTIDSLEPTDQELLPVLGNLRYRLEPRLRQQSIALDWQVQDVPQLSCLTPKNVLHVLRILQEAFANVLKHARASSIRVTTAIERGCVAITVADDGRGFEPGSRGQGHGLGNMLDRARQIGAELRIEPGPKGTRLSLLLPMA